MNFSDFSKKNYEKQNKAKLKTNRKNHVKQSKDRPTQK